MCVWTSSPVTPVVWPFCSHGACSHGSYSSPSHCWNSGRVCRWNPATPGRRYCRERNTLLYCTVHRGTSGVLHQVRYRRCVIASVLYQVYYCQVCYITLQQKYNSRLWFYTALPFTNLLQNSLVCIGVRISHNIEEQHGLWRTTFTYTFTISKYFTDFQFKSYTGMILQS